jgi:hypothetical protein
MPERFFRYVPTARANAWERAGWTVTSGPLLMQPPVVESGDDKPIEVVIVEWQRAGQPIEPSEERTVG